MPFKDKRKQREYQQQWYAKRRADWLSDKCCAVCGCVDNLQIDHIDPDKKLSHRVWSWSKKRMLAELDKCQVLCEDHHKDKTASDRRAHMSHGTRSMYVAGCKCDECKKANSAYEHSRRTSGRIHLEW